MSSLGCRNYYTKRVGNHCCKGSVCIVEASMMHPPKQYIGPVMYDKFQAGKKKSMQLLSISGRIKFQSSFLFCYSVIYQEDIGLTTLVQSSQSSPCNLTLEVALIFCILRSSMVSIKQKNLRMHGSCFPAYRRRRSCQPQQVNLRLLSVCRE